MFAQHGALAETLAAQGTRVGPVSSVCSAGFSEPGTGTKGLFTVHAFVGSLAGVRPAAVCAQVRAAGEASPAAVPALTGLLPRVGSLVGTKVGGVLKAFPTVRTLERFLPRVGSLVSDQTPASPEALPTHPALVWTLLLVGRPAQETRTPSRSLSIFEEPVGSPCQEWPWSHESFPQVSGLRHQLSRPRSLEGLPWPP